MQTITYYKDNTRKTRFVKETGELLHIFTNGQELTLSIQIVEESQRDNMGVSLNSHAETCTADEFNQTLVSVKESINNL